MSRSGKTQKRNRVVDQTAEKSLRQELRSLRAEVEELRSLSDLKEHYLSVATHELGTPLTAIKSYVEALTENYGDPNFTQGPLFLKVLDRETSRLIRIVERTLQISRLTSRSQLMQRSCFNLREVLDEIIDSMLPVLEERGIDVDVQVRIEDSGVEADRDLLKQVFINLIHNAVKFSPRDTTIVVKAKKAVGQASFEVHDQGYGIGQEEMLKVFDPYFRSSDERVTCEQGTGLGLAIVKTIIEQHGGSIRVESELEGGTSFYFQLPQTVVKD